MLELVHVLLLYLQSLNLHLPQEMAQKLRVFFKLSKVSEESDKFFVVIECYEHNQSENVDF